MNKPRNQKEAIQILRESLANLIEQATPHELETIYRIRPTYKLFVMNARKALEYTKGTGKHG